MLARLNFNLQASARWLGQRGNGARRWFLSIYSIQQAWADVVRRWVWLALQAIPRYCGSARMVLSKHQVALRGQSLKATQQVRGRRGRHVGVVNVQTVPCYGGTTAQPFNIHWAGVVGTLAWSTYKRCFVTVAQWSVKHASSITQRGQHSTLSCDYLSGINVGLSRRMATFNLRLTYLINKHLWSWSVR